MKQPKTALMSCGCRFSGRRGFYRKCAFHELTARAFWSQVPDEERPPGRRKHPHPKITVRDITSQVSSVTLPDVSDGGQPGGLRRIKGLLAKSKPVTFTMNWLPAAPRLATVWLGCLVCGEELRVVLREGKRLARTVRHCGARWEIKAEGLTITALQWRSRSILAHHDHVTHRARVRGRGEAALSRKRGRVVHRIAIPPEAVGIGGVGQQPRDGKRSVR